MTELEQLVRGATRDNVAAWMEAYGKIQLKTGEICDVVCNTHQLKFSRIIQWCKENGRPCRIVGLKPRQRGSSTVSVAVAHNELKHSRKRGLIAGGAHFQGQNLFRILKTYAENDARDPGCCTVLDTVARYKSGSEMDRVTLANANAGRSGTYQVMVITEVAYLAEEGVANAEHVLNGLLKCVPLEAGTIVIQESTPNGASGSFFNTYQTGVTFEEFQQGKTGYIKVFTPWFEFDDLQLDPETQGLKSTADYTKKEEELAKLYGLNIRQVAWMRYAIKDECQGSFDRFQQDYPFNDEDCFLRSGSGVFNAEGLRYQDQLAHIKSGFEYTHGRLEWNDKNKRCLCRPCDENESAVVRFEKPRVGCRYLVFCDPCTGDSRTHGSDPDSHSYGVLRAGFIDAATGRWHEPALVMRNVLFKDGERFGNWWDVDVVADELYAMSKYYGGCPIVVETNKDIGIIEHLKLKGDANLYVREVFNQRENTKTNMLGWETTKKTKPLIISGLQQAIREAGKGQINEGIQIRCPWALKQFRNFIRKPDGSTAAAAGHHDDDVMAIGIGLITLPCATAYAEQTRPAWIPPDLRGFESDDNNSGGQYS